MEAKENLKKLYIDWLNLRLAYKDLEAGSIEITTPFLDRHNDRMQIYALPLKDGEMKLTDDGYVLSDFEISGLKLNSSQKRMEIFNTILAGFGISYQADTKELFVITDIKDYPRKKHTLLQAMMTVNDMFMTTKSTVTSLFAEDVGTFLENNDIRFSENIFLSGKSGYNHNFNYLIPHFKTVPERVIHTMNVPSKGNLSNIIFSWGDTRENRSKLPYKSSLYVFINDQEKNVDKNIIKAFHNEDIYPVLWSSRNTVIKELSA